MSIILALTTGNWTANSTWVGNTIPSFSDVVVANGKTITINQSVACQEVRNDLTGSASGNGYFSISNGTTLTGNVFAGNLVTACSCVVLAGTANATINGIVTGNEYGPGSTGIAAGTYGVNNTGTGTIFVKSTVQGANGMPAVSGLMQFIDANTALAKVRAESSLTEITLRNQNYTGVLPAASNVVEGTSYANGTVIGTWQLSRLSEPYSPDLDFGTGEWNISAWVNIPSGNSTPGIILTRSYSTGPYITLGLDANNFIYSTVSDNTYIRSVSTNFSCNTNSWIKTETQYTTDGKLALLINGKERANTTGTPLQSLNNANAVFTIGNSYDLTSPFPGSITLVKATASVPTPEQSVFMYEQEKELFNANTKCVVPYGTDILDIAYDESSDIWTAVQANNDSTWTGLVRTSSNPVPNGSYTLVSADSGTTLFARSTTDPGVDVLTTEKSLVSILNSTDDYGLLTDQNIVNFDYSTIGFRANTTTNSSNLTSVSVINGTPYVGMRITGNNIPSGAYLTGIFGNYYYMSNNATGNTTSTLAQADFSLPEEYNSVYVSAGGVLKQEGDTKDFTLSYDGFKETVIFNTSPGTNTWVQLSATRII